MAGASQELVLSGIRRRFGTVEALRGIDLSVRDGEFLTILGPSGSGKTTLLKILAGFEFPDEGHVSLAGRDVTRTAPARRGIGMVFQQYALFPHLSVAQNVAFPLEMRKVKRSEIRARVAEVLALVVLDGYGGRLPRELSGGQQQRVALARAIVFRPRLLLLDEPLGALDRSLREQMQLEIKRLQHRLGLTTVFVTHDQEEALVMSDRIAVMNAGRVEQLDTPDAIYRRPASRFVAGFIGESNLLEGDRTAPGTVRIPGGPDILHAADERGLPSQVCALIRPERPRRLLPDERFPNVVEGQVRETIYLGESVKIRLEMPGGRGFLVRWPARDADEIPAVGEHLRVGFDRRDVHLVPAA